MEEIMDELERYEYEEGGELVAWLREQIDSLEYEAIVCRIDRLREAGAEAGAAG